MDKVKQNIDLQEAIQRYNIEKSVVGTLAYNIDQNLQKGMSPDEAIENVLQKSKSMPIGTIHNGFKKIADGKWRKVSTSEMTKEEHEAQAAHHNEQRVKNPSEKDGKGSWHLNQENTHKRVASNLDGKDYSDDEVTGGEKKEESQSDYFVDKFQRKMSGSIPSVAAEWIDGIGELSDKEKKEVWGNIQSDLDKKSKDRAFKKFDWMNTEKSLSSSTLSKSEQKEAQKTKVKKVMDEWKRGELKSSSGEKVTDQKRALAIALS